MATFRQSTVSPCLLQWMGMIDHWPIIDFPQCDHDSGIVKGLLIKNGLCTEQVTSSTAPCTKDRKMAFTKKKQKQKTNKQKNQKQVKLQVRVWSWRWQWEKRWWNWTCICACAVKKIPRPVPWPRVNVNWHLTMTLTVLCVNFKPDLIGNYRICNNTKLLLAYIKNEG